MKTKYFIIPVLLFLSLGLISAFGISTCTELQAMEGGLDGDYYLVQDIDCSDTVNWNNGSGFDPVGPAQAENGFTGNFDGRGYTISDLYINRPSADANGEFIGLFGSTGPTAVIEDVHLVNVNITGWQKVGALVGANYGNIIGCSLSGNVEITSASSQGGITAIHYAGYINNTYVDADISFSGNSPAGGIAGSVYSQGNIFNSYVLGDITCTAERCGGLVGDSTEPHIVNSYYIGTVSGTNEVGGLVGRHFQGRSIINCYSRGSVIGTDEVGGLVGHNEGNSPITNSYSTSSVTCSTNCGGLIGSYGGGTITSSFWDNETSGQTTSGGAETGLTTADMTTFSTYDDAGWDISTVTTETNDGYPYLSNGAWFIYENTAPKISNEQTTVSVQPWQSYIYDYEATDLEGDSLTWITNSTLFGIGSTTGIITFTPNDEQSGTYFILVSVTDGEFTDTDTFTFTIPSTTEAIQTGGGGGAVVTGGAAITGTPLFAAGEDAPILNLFPGLKDFNLKEWFAKTFPGAKNIGEFNLNEKIDELVNRIKEAFK